MTTVPITTSPLRIAILDDYQQVAESMARWDAIPGARVTAFGDHLDDPEALAERLADFPVVCLMRERTPFGAGLIARLPALRLIVTSGMWNASVDVAAARQHGVEVCGTVSASAGTPELTWLLLLALARRLPQELRAMAEGGWQVAVGEEMEGRTLGIIGLGHIGQRVARVANAFGMRVLAWSHNLDAARAQAAGAVLAGSMEELLEAADFVTLHTKLSARTQGLIGAAELARMKPSAFLVNTSRGPIVSEPALIDALRHRRIAGAALDVYDQEPLPSGHPLRTLPNLIATPHIGYVTENAYRGHFTQYVEDILAWQAGAPLRRLADDTGGLQRV